MRTGCHRRVQRLRATVIGIGEELVFDAEVDRLAVTGVAARREEHDPRAIAPQDRLAAVGARHLLHTEHLLVALQQRHLIFEQLLSDVLAGLCAVRDALWAE